MKVTILLLLVCIFAVVTVNEARGRGARFSRSRFTRYSRYSRYKSYSRFRAYRSRSWSVRMKQVAILAGSVYIARKMRMRLGYGRYHGSYDFEICRNFRRYPSFNGSTRANVYGWFICPTDNVPMDNIYCCGPEGLQYCCGYWSNPGKVAGMVIGLIIVLGIVIAIVYFCCCRNRNRNRGPPAAQQVQYKQPSEQATMHVQPAVPPPVAAPAPSYPLLKNDKKDEKQPAYGAAQPYTPPPSYDAASSPYPTNPPPGPGYGPPPPQAPGYGPPPPQAPGYGPPPPQAPGYGAPPPPGFYPPAPTGPGYPAAPQGYPEKAPYPS